MADKRAADALTEIAGTMPAAPESNAMPGGRAALPAGSLPTTYLGAQGDEQRDPPAGAPSAIPPSPLVEREVSSGSARGADMRFVGRLGDFADGGITRKKIGDTEIILVRTGSDIRAVGADCPHAGAPLDGGAVCNGRLICPWHKAEFRVSDGAVMEPPALDGLIRYATRIDGDDVLVDMDSQPEEPQRPREDGRTIAIVGSGAAGVAAAAELRRLGFGGRVLLIGPEADEPYDRTALSKFVLSGDMKPDEVPPLRDADWFASSRVELIAVSVSRVDADDSRLYLSDGRSLSYDAALLAIGAVAKRPSIPGMTLRGVYTLRGTQDAAAIMTAATDNAHVVIMGSSFIGLEAASALRKRGLRVTVVAPDDIPFGRQFGPEIGGMFRRLHEANGVVFRLGSGVEALEGTHAVEGVRLKGGEAVPADFVLVGVGVEPATKDLPGVLTRPDGSIAVDRSFRFADRLYAAGDCATFPFQGKTVRIEHWRLAQQHGRHAAAAMLGDDAAYGGVPFFWTYHYGKRFEYLGHPAEWDAIHIEGALDEQDFVALQVKNDYVVGVIACQRERTTAMLIDRMREPLPLAEALGPIGLVKKQS
jgi:NADPH-dependent 2,4-dienoyl-CoA reductase/sulfur reductase-like enzyme/nitrite reductase/ring-hydroxylating ferredoxin subunit